MGRLVLTRKIGQRIFINDEQGGLIKVTLSKIRDGQAVFMIEAPDDIAIHREEIYNKIHNN